MILPIGVSPRPAGTGPRGEGGNRESLAIARHYRPRKLTEWSGCAARRSQPSMKDKPICGDRPARYFMIGGKSRWLMAGSVGFAVAGPARLPSVDPRRGNQVAPGLSTR